VSMVVVGAGNRGTVYSNYALDRPDLCRVVAVAEPRAFAREKIAALHGIPPERQFTGRTRAQTHMRAVR
jgi:hypothetical protein